MSRLSPRGVPATPWAQKGPWNDTRDMWRHREGLSDPNVGEGPGR